MGGKNERQNNPFDTKALAEKELFPRKSLQKSIVFHSY
tara:strand:+ start:304 stop:417 length:114 start_codon:yes stop_codon:yes gene_type:complete